MVYGSVKTSIYIAPETRSMSLTFILPSVSLGKVAENRQIKILLCLKTTYFFWNFTPSLSNLSQASFISLTDMAI